MNGRRATSSIDRDGRIYRSSAEKEEWMDGGHLRNIDEGGGQLWGMAGPGSGRISGWWALLCVV